MPGVTTAYQSGVHGSRPAAGAGCILYACSTHSLIYRSDGTTWTTWMTIGSSVTTVASDAIWDAAGDLAVGTGADTAARLAIGATSKVPTVVGGTLAYAYPPGYEFDYVEKTSNTTITSPATTEGNAATIVTGNAVTYDGSTIVLIEYYHAQLAADVNKDCHIVLEDNGSAIGDMAYVYNQDPTNSFRNPMMVARRLTPSAGPHTFSIRGYVNGGTFTVVAGAGGAGATMPCFIRQTKV